MSKSTNKLQRSIDKVKQSQNDLQDQLLNVFIDIQSLRKKLQFNPQSITQKFVKSFLSLNIDLIVLTFEFLPYQEIISMRFVSRKFNKLIGGYYFEYQRQTLNQQLYCLQDKLQITQDDLQNFKETEEQGKEDIYQQNLRFVYEIWMKDLVQVKSYRVPPECLFQVWRSVCLILWVEDGITDNQFKQRFQQRDWRQCQMMMQYTSQFMDRVINFDINNLTTLQIQAIELVNDISIEQIETIVKAGIKQLASLSKQQLKIKKNDLKRRVQFITSKINIMENIGK